MSEQMLGQWYSQRSGWQRVQGTKLLDLAAPQPGERVLDVGCGTGEITELLSDAVGPTGQVTGVDIDAGRLHVAQQRPRRANLTYEQASGEQACRQQTAAYDLLFSNYVIHWMPDRPRFMAAACRALRPGGRLVLSTIEALPILFQTFCELAGTPGRELLGRMYFVRREQLVGELTAAGFQIALADVSPETKQFASVEAALEYWEATTAGTVRKAAISTAALAELERDPLHCQAQIAEAVVRIVATKSA